jgi:hypothetical protein
MAFFNPSNQLIQIDTGNVLTYMFNPASSPISVYANIGEIQVLGQRYVGINAITTANPSGSPAIYVLAKMLATSAATLAAWQTANAPAPVYWTDTTFTTVSPIMSEGFGGLQASVAGYWMPNYASLPKVTLAQLQGAYGLVQVAGYLPGAYCPANGTLAAGNWLIGNAGSYQSAGVAAASGPGYRALGIQIAAASSNLANVLVLSDII